MTLNSGMHLHLSNRGVSSWSFGTTSPNARLCWISENIKLTLPRINTTVVNALVESAHNLYLLCHPERIKINIYHTPFINFYLDYPHNDRLGNSSF